MPRREARFGWALGDLSEKTRRRERLPFDAAWESRKLIVEVDEEQHRLPVRFWDKPGVVTVSGVDRGRQRRIYDDRKRRAAREQGYTVLEIEWASRPPLARRDRGADRRELQERLVDCGVLPLDTI